MTGADKYYFISYSGAEEDTKQFVLRLQGAFKHWQPSVDVWIYEEEMRLHAGERWRTVIDEKLRTCEGVFFVVTPGSVSEFNTCEEEWGRALDYWKKPVIPLLIARDLEPPFGLYTVQHINFRESFDEGIRNLSAYLSFLETEEGQLEQLKLRLARTNYTLSRVKAEDKARISEEIAYLNTQITQKEALVKDPEGVATRTRERVHDELASECQPVERIRLATVKVVNSPPEFAPQYFQDRYVETGLVVDFSTNPAQRIAIVHGRHGIGKTAMVCRLLEALERDQLPDDRGAMLLDGIVYLWPGTLDLPNMYRGLCKLLPQDLAYDLESVARQSGNTTERLMQALLECFSDRKAILLLDNMDAVTDSLRLTIRVKELFEALRAVLVLPHHGVKVIITASELPADLAEIEPGRQGIFPIDEGLPSPYAENVLRSMDVQGRLGIKTASDRLLAEARERTRGYPRALEALVAVLRCSLDTSLQEILDDTARLLPENVVEQLVGEAYSRTDPATQQVLQALAVYGRPVTKAAVDYLLLPYVPGVDCRPTLHRLVNMRLARKDQQKYYLHPVDRSYALSRLQIGEPSDRGANTPPRFTAFALWDRAAEYWRQIRVPRENWKSLEDLEPQLAEFDLRCQGKDYRAALGVLDSIDYSWTNHHKFLAYLTFFGRGDYCVDKRTALLGKAGTAELEIANRTSLRWVCRRMGRKTEAETHLRQAVTDTQACEDCITKVYALSELGYFLTDNAGKHDEAEKYLDNALRIARTARDQYAEAHTLLGLAFADFQRQQNASSLNTASQALELFQNVKTPVARYRELDCQVRLGMIHRKAGDLDAAVESAEKGLELARRYGLKSWEAELYSGLGFHHRAGGYYDSALFDHQQSLEIFKAQLGMRREEAVQHSYIANLYMDVGQLDKAEGEYQEAQRVAEFIGIQRELSWILANHGILMCRLGNYDQAQELQQRALEIVRKNNHLDSQVLRYTCLANTLVTAGLLNMRCCRRCRAPRWTKISVFPTACPMHTCGHDFLKINCRTRCNPPEITSGVEHCWHAFICIQEGLNRH
jgi:tetratricopeptide (TPR) repeat protein